MSAPCKWQEAGGESNLWDTGCGELFQLTHDTPTDNNMRFCCYCGGALEQVRYVPDDEDEA